MLSISLSLLFVATLYVQLTSSLAELVKKPENTVAVVGTIATLNCATSHNSSVLWIKYVLGSEPLTISAGKEVAPDSRNTYSILNPQPGVFNLQIYPITFAVAGSYGCLDTTLKTSYADLLIIKLPSCYFNTSSLAFTGETFFISCQFEYQANWPPIFDWNEPKYSPEALSLTGVEGGQPWLNTTLASSLKYFAATPDLRNKDIVCDIYFPRPPFELDGGATNRPRYKYQYVWNWARRRGTGSRQPLPESSPSPANAGFDSPPPSTPKRDNSTIIYVATGVSGGLFVSVVLSVVLVTSLKLRRMRSKRGDETVQEPIEHSFPNPTISEPTHSPPPVPPRTKISERIANYENLAKMHNAVNRPPPRPPKREIT